MTRPSWKINLAFIWIGVFVGLMGANFVFPFIPFYIQDLGVEGESRVAFYTSLTASATGLSLTLTAPIWGTLADRYGRKPMFMRALIGAGVLIAFMGIAQAVWQLVALRFLMGAFAGTMGAAAALVASTTPRAKVGYALGLLQTGQFTANMLGPVIGGLVAASLGIRESFIFCAALYLLAALLVFLFVREEPMVSEIESPPGEALRGRPKSGSIVSNMRTVVAERQVVFMLLLLFSLWLSTTFVRPVMPITIDNFAGASERVHVELPGWTRDLKEEAATGLVFGFIGLTSTVAAFAVAPLGERLGYRNTVGGAAIIAGLLYPTVALAGGVVSFALLLGAVGLFQGAMVPGTNALIAASTPEGQAGQRLRARRQHAISRIDVGAARWRAYHRPCGHRSRLHRDRRGALARGHRLPGVREGAEGLREEEETERRSGVRAKAEVRREHNRMVERRIANDGQATAAVFDSPSFPVRRSQFALGAPTRIPPHVSPFFVPLAT